MSKFHSLLTVAAAFAAVKGIQTVECPTTCVPKLCTDDATIRGTASHLTYLCPEETPTALKTILVTVTQTQTVSLTPTVTEIGKSPGTPAPKDTSNEEEKTTTITESRTSTISVTKTVQSAKPTSSVVETSAAKISSVPSDITLDDPYKTSSCTSSTSTSTIIQTITLSTPFVPFPSLSVSANGTISGIFRTLSGSPYIPTGYPTEYPTNYPIYGAPFRRDNAEEGVVKVYSTVYVSVDRRSPSRSVTEPYPGAITLAMGKLGGASKAGMSSVALAVGWLVAALML